MPNAPWFFPVPTRASRFVAASPSFEFLNREVALDLLRPWNFQNTSSEDELLYFDYQNQLENNAHGRLGAGRAGVYGGYYLKGVGRTLAAANWNFCEDRYHASGHLSVSSALREFLITKTLQEQKLSDAIVPCEAILLSSLDEEERRYVEIGHTSARPGRPADMQMMALSAKPANFSRQSNIVWAFDHFSQTPALLGELFLALEQATSINNEAKEGDPREIAEALSQAFARGLQNFLRFAKEGVYWLYLQNNFTLDGRFVDLETPLYVGQPLLGMRYYKVDNELVPQLFGFEVFGFIVQWRLFIRWLRAKLSLLNTPPIMREKTCRAYLRGFSQELQRVFSPKNLLYQDETLQEQLNKLIMETYDLNRKAKAQLKELTASAFQNTVNGVEHNFVTKGWKRAEFGIDTPMVDPLMIDLPPFVTPTASAAAQKYSAQLHKLMQSNTPEELFSEIKS
jgi:hypothetical protein